MLDINDDLIGAKFAHVSSSANGTSVSSDVEHCYYRGVLAGEPTSSVTVHTCGDGIESSIRTEQGEHIVTMPSSRVSELRNTKRRLHDSGAGELPQHVAFRTSDHLLWRRDDHEEARG